jgi:hypothetical protein
VSDRAPNTDNPDELVIEVDGEGVHIDTLDAPAVLEFTVAYLNLLKLCATERDEDLEFRGLRSFEKCGSLATLPSNPEIARQATLEAFKLLSSRDRPMHGLKIAVQRVRETREALPSHYTTIVKVRGLSRVISSQPVSVIADTPFATNSMRVYVQRVGGATPKATFRSSSEPKVFHLALRDAEQGADLANYLYKYVDITALVLRDADGHIESGVVREFFPVSEENARRAWDEWFKESGMTSLDELEARGRGDG